MLRKNRGIFFFVGGGVIKKVKTKRHGSYKERRCGDIDRGEKR
jgi:hypothetical protein